jgi:protein TonB
MWVNENLVYPKEAYEDGTQGKVTVQFTIDKTGEVRDVCVLRGVHPALDKEAVRVISSSPKWTPAIYDGKPASVTYNFPVVFQLE